MSIGQPFSAVFGIISIAGTAVGIGSGIYELSSSRRAQHTVQWVNATIDNRLNQTDRRRAKTLNKICLAAEGRLVAAYHVPMWRLILTSVAIAFSPFFIWSAATNRLPLPLLILLTINACCLYCFVCCREIIALNERRRIENEYVKGKFDAYGGARLKVADHSRRPVIHAAIETLSLVLAYVFLTIGIKGYYPKMSVFIFFAGFIVTWCSIMARITDGGVDTMIKCLKYFLRIMKVSSSSKDTH